jgi:hypothetical protein
MLFITLMIKMSDTAEAKYKYDKNSPKLSVQNQGLWTAGAKTRKVKGVLVKTGA